MKGLSRLNRVTNQLKETICLYIVVYHFYLFFSHFCPTRDPDTDVDQRCLACIYFRTGLNAIQKHEFAFTVRRIAEHISHCVNFYANSAFPSFLLGTKKCCTDLTVAHHVNLHLCMCIVELCIVELCIVELCIVELCIVELCIVELSIFFQTMPATSSAALKRKRETTRECEQKKKTKLYIEQ